MSSILSFNDDSPLAIRELRARMGLPEATEVGTCIVAESMCSLIYSTSSVLEGYTLVDVNHGDIIFRPLSPRRKPEGRNHSGSW